MIEKNPNITDFPNLFGSANFTCEVSGTPQPSITWYKDGVLLEGEQRPTLIIPEVALSDRGFYSCRASNSDPATDTIASEISEKAILSINSKKTMYSYVALCILRVCV